MPARFIPTLVKKLPAITSTTQKGKVYLIEFEHPLDMTQTGRIRGICLALQDIRKGILFAYEFLPAMPTEGEKASSRQSDCGAQVLRISRKNPSKCQDFQPYPLSQIAAQVVSALEA